jgi:glutathione S-transferase
LEELNPEPRLFGSDPWQRAVVDMWIRRIELALANRIGAVWINTHKYTARLGIQYKDYGEAMRVRALEVMRWLDGEIAGREFICSQQYSMADIIALTTIDFGQFIGIEIPADLERLRDWHKRVSARPSAAA